MAARDIFDGARDASFELWRHDMRYNAMERRALAVPGGLVAGSVHGGARDATARVDAMADYEAMMERRVAAWCDRIDAACRILYGDDWEHGIATSLSMSHAEVLDCIYIQRMSLTETARRVHWSDRKVCDLRREAFAHIDAVGPEAAAMGL